MTFTHFDPLKIPDRQSVEESLLRDRQKRNIYSILHSYVGWYDPFSELIQNALDSVDKRALISSGEYTKKISIKIDSQNNYLTVSDNGTGLDEASFEQFLAPNVSFKDDTARGSKGVGATYLAYGFNYLRVDTKTKNFAASGELEGGRTWLHDHAAAQNPHVYPTTKIQDDPLFAEFDAGASVTVGFDVNSRPSDIGWPNLNTAEAWAIALQIKTALGPILECQAIESPRCACGKEWDPNIPHPRYNPISWPPLVLFKDTSLRRRSR